GASVLTSNPTEAQNVVQADPTIYQDLKNINDGSGSIVASTGGSTSSSNTAGGVATLTDANSTGMGYTAPAYNPATGGATYSDANTGGYPTTPPAPATSIGFTGSDVVPENPD